METILIVCSAGASSTFLASRMRAIAASRSRPITVVAISQPDLASRLHEASVLLVGPHLADSYPDIARDAARFGVASALLPPTAFGPRGADDAIGMLDGLLGSDQLVPGVPTTGHSEAQSRTEGITHG